MKKILQGFSLVLFILPPAYFVFSQSSQSSIFTKINLGGCFLFIAGFLFAKRFILAKFVEKWRGMIIHWSAELLAEPDATKKQMLRHLIGKYENIMLAIKVPVPALIIIGILTFLFAVQRTASNLAAMLGICSAFWICAVILLFISNRIGAKKPKE